MVLLGIPVSLPFRLIVPVKISTSDQFLTFYLILVLATCGGAQPRYFHSFDGAAQRRGVSLVNGSQLEGSVATTFDLGIFSEQGWAVTNTIPASITLQPGEVYNVEVPVVVPPNATAGDVDEVVLVAAPVTDIGLSTSAMAEVNVVDQIRIYLPLITRP